MKRLIRHAISGRFVFLSLLVLLLPGCLQTTRINSDPPGAHVSVNGAPFGKTPLYYRTRAGVPKTYFLEIVKPGYKPVETKVESNYRADASLALLLPGTVPYFFSARLEDDYKYSLIQERSTSKR